MKNVESMTKRELLEILGKCKKEQLIGIVREQDQTKSKQKPKRGGVYDSLSPHLCNIKDIVMDDKMELFLKNHKTKHDKTRSRSRSRSFETQGFIFKETGVVSPIRTEKLDAIIEKIDSHAKIHPVALKRINHDDMNPKYEIIDGRHRVIASILKGYNQVPCDITPMRKFTPIVFE